MHIKLLLALFARSLKHHIYYFLQCTHHVTSKTIGGESQMWISLSVPFSTKCVLTLSLDAELKTTTLDNSSLHLACSNGHVGVAKVLIAAGCDIEARFVHIYLFYPNTTIYIHEHTLLVYWYYAYWDTLLQEEEKNRKNYPFGVFDNWCAA